MVHQRGCERRPPTTFLRLEKEVLAQALCVAFSASHSHRMDIRLQLLLHGRMQWPARVDEYELVMLRCSVLSLGIHVEREEFPVQALVNGQT